MTESAETDLPAGAKVRGQCTDRQQAITSCDNFFTGEKNKQTKKKPSCEELHFWSSSV